MMRYGRVVAAGAVLTCAFAWNAGGAILIDNFTTFQGPLIRVVPGDFGTPISSPVDGGGIIGGERDILVQLTSAAGPPGNRINVSVTSYNHSQDGGVFGQSLAVWDGNDNNGAVIDFTGLGGMDLTQDGTQEAIQMSIISADLNSLITLTVYTDGSNASEYDLLLTGGSANEVYNIPYTSFTTISGTGADFTNVGAVTMLVDGSAVSSLDVILELLQTVSLLNVDKTDALFDDIDGDGNVDPGETIRYTITLNNPIDDDLGEAVQNVIFNDTPDANTSLVVPSVTTTQGTVLIGNTAGDTSVSVDVGDINDGVTVTITFDVTVDAEVTQVCNQGFATDHPSNDPGSMPADDPTCTPVTFCGDGIVNDATEECDDGNMSNNDSCTNECLNARCGDGFVQPPEECDDGNMSNNDACTNVCLNAECGDGFVQPPEQCDDGNMINTDTCTNVCENARCGDGFAQPPEECDDGNVNNNDACTNACNTAECGDGIVQTGTEECDDGNMNNNDGCTNACLNAECGDGIVQTGVEECDDGNVINNDGCTNACTLPECGDGIVQAGEQCDDGNTNNNDGCTNICTLPQCGDGIVQPPEQCDDDNNTAGDGCSPTCNNEICGNNILDPGEECDGTANAACAGALCQSNCTCPDDDVIPTVSEWGLVIIALLMLTGAKVAFGRSTRFA